jgi:hypothetical protein
MHPESVEIKVTLSGSSVAAAVTALELPEGQNWSILFCEDITTGVAPSTPLLDIGVVLRTRKKSGTQGDSTVKLRPCRWSQLSEDFFTNRKDSVTELKIEADWAGPKRTLAASLTREWNDDRVDAVRSGRLAAADLFEKEQRRFLQECSSSPVNLDALAALPDIAATRWKAFTAKLNGRELSVRAERWMIDRTIDFLELSIVSDLDRAERDQAGLHHFLAKQGLHAEQNQENKTQRVLSYLAAQTASAA